MTEVTKILLAIPGFVISAGWLAAAVALLLKKELGAERAVPVALALLASCGHAGLGLFFLTYL